MRLAKPFPRRQLLIPLSTVADFSISTSKEKRVEAEKPYALKIKKSAALHR